jgi:hypothetical protein
MSTRAAPWPAWSLVVLSVVLFVGGIALALMTRSSTQGRPYYDPVDAVFTLATVLTFSVVGAVIASRRPAHPPGEPFASGKMTQLDHVNRSPLRQNTVSRGKEPALGHSPPADRVQVFAG